VSGPSQLADSGGHRLSYNGTMKTSLAALLLLLVACKRDDDDPPDTSVDTVDSEVTSSLPDAFALGGDELFPESGVFDPVLRRFLFGSLTSGVISSLEVDTGAQASFYADPAPEQWSIRGLKADLTRRRLWACAEFDDGSENSRHVWWLNLDTGLVAQRFNLSTLDADAWCRDIAISPSGDVFVTDPINGRIYQVDAINSAVRVQSAAEALGDGAIGATGIELTLDGKGLIIARYSRPTLLYLDLSSPENTREITLAGDDPGLGASEGYAGMVFKQGALYVAAVRAVLRITSDQPDWGVGQVTRIPIDGSGFTAVTEVEESVYALESDPLAWQLGIRPDLPFRWLRVPEN
jgi:hypothetical protein